MRKFFFSALFLCISMANAEVLTVKDALGFANSHPAINKPILRSQEQQLIFLNCHDLTFNDNNKSNSWDNLPLYDLMEPLVAQKIEILRRYFDVILADISFAANNEHMAIAFINADRARVRSELGQYSEVEVAALESIYQGVRQARFASEKNQRTTRAKLALAMGDINKLAPDLVEPVLKIEELKVPDYDKLTANALKHNSRLFSLQSSLDSAEYKLLKMRLQQQLLTLILRLEMLSFAKDNAAALSYYRDIYMDRSRALYEMEVKADLGDSMVWQSRALMQEATVDFCIALTFAEINALQGKDIWPVTNEK